MKIAGQGGQIKWGYIVAANLGSWHFEGTGQGGSLTGTVTSHNRFRLTQRPLVVVVPAGLTELRWPVMDVGVEGTTVTAVVGSRERKG